MDSFFYGAFAAGFTVAAAFFLKFWRQTREALLLVFACAFGVLAASYGLLGLVGSADEERGPVYLVRLAAFALIIAGVVRKNLRER